MWFHLPCYLSFFLSSHFDKTETKLNLHYFIYICSVCVWGGRSKTYGLLIHFYVFKILESAALHGK